MHGITEDGLRVRGNGRSLQVKALDVAVASFGERTAYPVPVNRE